MGVIAEGIPRGCQGLFTPVSLGYPLSVFNKNSTLKGSENETVTRRKRGKRGGGEQRMRMSGKRGAGRRGREENAMKLTVGIPQRQRVIAVMLREKN